MRLGLDIGTNSIGWWLYATNDKRTTEVLDGGVRIFSDGREPKSGASLAVDRRVARAARRRRDRYLRRRASLMKKLAAAGLMPTSPAEAKALEQLDPYTLRAEGLDRVLPLNHLGRALFHLNQRRGFKSNRKTDRRDNESGLIKQATARLDHAMMAMGARTYGEFLHMRRKAAVSHRQTPPARTRLTMVKRNDAEQDEAGYDFYPDRRHLSEEFDRIWVVQAPHYPEILTDALREALYQTIFYQRPLKAPEVGRCLFTDERRLPKAHPLAERRVLYETVNALRISAPGKVARPLSEDQRDSIVLALDSRKHTKSMSGMTKKFKTLAKVLKLGADETFTLETVNRDFIACDRVRASMSHPDRFGHQWVSMDAEDQWAIIDKLRTEENRAALVDWLMTEQGLDLGHAEATVDAPLPEGYSRIGETATRRILKALQSDVLTYSEAVDVCGWHHSDLRTGEVLSELPYYGAVLDRHVIPGTQDPNDDDITRYGRISNPTVDLPRFDSGSATHLSGLLFEGQGAFTSQS